MWLEDGEMRFATPAEPLHLVRPGVWGCDWTFENSVRLTELGVPCISPMARDYNFPCKNITPYSFQIQGADFLARTRRGYMLADMGTGKTIISLWAFDYLRSIGAVKKALVICPKNIVFSAWADEIKTHLPHLRFSAVVGSSAQKERALNKRADVYIINHDGVHYELDLLLQHKFCIVIYDESSAIGDTMAMRHKAVRKLLTPHTYFWEATGTPTSQSPMSAHGQIRLMANVDQTGKTFRPHMDPKQPFFTKTAWKSLTMVQESQYSWRPRKNSNEIVFKYMQPAFRVSKAQVLKDIKEPVMLRRDVGLSAEQIKAIKELEVEKVHYAENGSVTAVNAAVLMSKIIQIACGCAYGVVDGPAGESDGEGRGLVEFSAKPKEDALLEMLENSEHGKLVYVPYRAPLERVATVCRKAGYRTVTVTGATRPRDFGEIMQAFQARSRGAPEVIVAIPQKMSHGVTATAADLTVWYAPVLRAEVFSQANNRMNRIGQDKFTRIGTIAANDLERKLYDRLTAMNLNESSLLSMYESVMSKGIL